ncbi:MAG TPA: hypothetical protein VIC55_11730 [Gemmatimonadaceae bacterium]|jgi:hypothetical protein
MNLSLSRWGHGRLLAAWSTYWVGLAAVTLTPTVVAILRALSASSGKASVSATLGNTVLNIVVTEAGKQTFSASAHLLPMALWIAVPPLALYGLWLFKRSRAVAEQREVAPAAALGDVKPDLDVPQRANVQSRLPHA